MQQTPLKRKVNPDFLDDKKMNNLMSLIEAEEAMQHHLVVLSFLLTSLIMQASVGPVKYEKRHQMWFDNQCKVMKELLLLVKEYFPDLES